jgi:hypothetical protein
MLYSPKICDTSPWRDNKMDDRIIYCRVAVRPEGFEVVAFAQF